MNFKKKITVILAIILALASLAACSNPKQSSGSSSVSGSSSAVSSPSSSESSSFQSTGVDAASSSVGSEAGSQAVSQADDAQKTLLLNIQAEAKKGRAINIPFAVKSNVIDDVGDKWGKEDKTEYIAAAKGNYATYSKHNAVFGFNKGSQLFEVRSFDSSLKSITLAGVKNVFGTPAYDVKSGKEEVIGYVVTKDFKILMVFPTAADGGEQKLDHYSVFYPAGTVNTMADDPGREW